MVWKCVCGQKTSSDSCLASCSHLPGRLLDTLPLARECVPDCANHKQGTLRQRFGVTLAPGEAEHDAGSDVTVLAQLLPHLVQVSLGDPGRLCCASTEGPAALGILITLSQAAGQLLCCEISSPAALQHCGAGVGRRDAAGTPGGAGAQEERRELWAHVWRCAGEQLN